MEVRMLTMNDYENMIELWTRADLPFKPKGRDSKLAVTSQMESGPNLFLGAFQGDTLVGAVIGSYDQRRKGWINRLAVDPKYQRQGIGQLLITSMEKILKEKGVSLICALIEEGSNESMRLFEKLGYVSEKSILYFSKRESKDV
jgi:ribosomal protein S18 acetylase RimI-like enzyme